MVTKPRTIPTAKPEDGTVKKRIPGRKPGPADRAEFIRLWDEMSDDGRKQAYFFMRSLSIEEGLLAEDADRFPVGRGGPSRAHELSTSHTRKGRHAIGPE
ncbi:hypothetical protein EOD42_22355 [Rhodovarius crocodyli]|uniref:Uncharacterized protein n=1 Tax=Rhodovarius crocodyli TaxID=1979269 RepID=A0A437M108_9PROT|nr:hypothetical protein [Rhodovarius crocodyli]RVT91400.1 hypothetical protein EOD42_22355 [Rhodovarius crocodyli]